jgi:hypothetical protein
MPDFRALCARMADELDHYRQLLMDDRRATHALAAEARAALAQPEPQGPTDEELKNLANKAWISVDVLKEYDLIENAFDCCGFARAVLARWGRPAIEPVPVSEHLPGPEDCDAEGQCWWWDEDDDMWRLSRHRPWLLCWTHWLPHWALPVPGVEGADA